MFRWNGTAWTTLAAFSSLVEELHAVEPMAVTGPDQFFVGSSLSSLGGTQGASIYFWNGSGWIGESAGPNGAVNDLVVLPNGDAYAIGAFTVIGGAPALRVARWQNGWQPVGAGLPSEVLALTALQNGDLVAVTNLGVHRFDGSTWQLMPGSPYSASASSTVMHVRSNGELLVATSYNPGFHRWDGTTWTSFSSIWAVRGMANLPNGDVVLTGASLSSFPISFGRIAVWDGGTVWTALDPGFQVINPSQVQVLRDGSVVVAQDDYFAPGRLWRFNGASWGIMGNLDNVAADLELTSGGDAIIVGGFTSSGGLSCPHVARWNGSASVRLVVSSADPNLVRLDAHVCAGVRPRDRRPLRWRRRPPPTPLSRRRAAGPRT